MPDKAKTPKNPFLLKIERLGVSGLLTKHVRWIHEMYADGAYKINTLQFRSPEVNHLEDSFDTKNAEHITAYLIALLGDVNEEEDTCPMCRSGRGLFTQCLYLEFEAYACCANCMHAGSLDRKICSWPHKFKHYHKKDPRREAGLSEYYMGKDIIGLPPPDLRDSEDKFTDEEDVSGL